MSKVLITTVPFADKNRLPLELLEAAGIGEVTLGIIGAGRVGSRVLRRIVPFGTPRVIVNDIHPNPKLVPELKLEWVGKEEIYRTADVISLHVPMTAQTRNMIRREQLL